MNELQKTTKKTTNKVILASSLLFGSLLSGTVFAETEYSNIYVFGDSLSDVGNLHEVDVDGSLTYGERFSNGPVIVEYVTQQLLGEEAVLYPSLHLAGLNVGTNYAVAGAVSIDEDGNENTPDINLPTQVNAYLLANNGVADPNALYMLTIGGNDVRYARGLIQQRIFDPENSATRIDAYQSLYQAASSVATQLGKLLYSGSQSIVLINTPDIGLIPETQLIKQATLAEADNFFERFQAKYIDQSATLLTTAYNAMLNEQINGLKTAFPEASISTFDLNGLLNDIVANPAEYNFTNVTDACNYLLTSESPALLPECLAPTSYLFFDEIHPTTSGHRIAAGEIVEQLENN
ncbi:SGNH/GDSL hydrolase family protein [Vibrio sp. SS-MA-C1-2]|uniref:SGNH/GDSL hydrolase family protein n=1 Tax=Vibrio sp. SS-MA-C1-2 TaxID=2908646 RepID=UPI001F435F43|nr:SGNH/GDSL hydrolase family protein [Vibrio sp. SS-MA-C1-2]UJF19275.1 SGNH/GDSL hydrolase family protein [Vibrio sp. SS-MA-C1-2]